MDGYPYHLESSPDIHWKTRRIKLRSAEAVERDQAALQKLPGEHYGIRVVAEPKLLPGRSWPRRSNVSEEAMSDGVKDDEKRAKMLAIQEEKARRKIEQMKQEGTEL